LETVTIPDSVLATVPDKLGPRKGDISMQVFVKRRAAAAAVTAVAVMLVTSCATKSSTPAASSTGTRLRVVAAENFWGSIATQIGGAKVEVDSIITNPDTDPHDYDPNSADARSLANAQVVIDNGIGYDPWAAKLLASNHVAGQHVVTVGDVVGVADGGNPHRWYNPDDVDKVIAAIIAAYQAADPADSAYFTAQQHAFATVGLAKYHAIISQIKATYAGTPVGASESIFAMIAPALGLNLLTPPTFLRAISEGTDPTSADKQTIDTQIKTHAIKVYVYNSQNATPDVQAQVDEATAAGIPVTTITETMAPATATFQDWQVSELTALQAALAAPSKGTGS
jgi:zinc/manganese transport system substrate-binding protein